MYVFKFLFFCFCTVSLQMRSQELSFSSDYEKSDIQDAFTLLGIENFKYNMPEELKGYYFEVIIREFRHGKEVSLKDHYKRFENMRNVLQWKNENKEYCLKIQTKKNNDSTEIYNLRLPGVGLRNNILKLNYPRSEYGWETLINSKLKLNEETEIPFLTFATEPQNTERPNTAVYCELSTSSNDYKNWFTKFKIEHYYVFLLKVTKK